MQKAHRLHHPGSEEFHDDVNIKKLYRKVLQESEIQFTEGTSPRALFTAILDGDELKVYNAINQRVNLNARDANGHSAVAIALLKDHRNIVKVLLEAGARFERTDFEILEKRIADLIGDEDYKPHDWLNIDRWEAGSGSGHKSLIGTALTRRHFNLARALLTTEPPKHVLSRLLNDSVARDCIQSTQLLIEFGADVEGVACIRPIITSAYRANRAMLSYLLQSGADPNAEDGQGGTALYIAARRGDVELVELLVKGGARPNTTVHYTRQPLYAAIERDDHRMVLLLIKAGADASNWSYATKTALEYAISMGPSVAKSAAMLVYSDISLFELFARGSIMRAEVLKQLILFFGISPNSLASSGKLLLEHAVLSDDDAEVEVLLASGADANLRSGTESVLDVAQERGYKKIEELFIKYGVQRDTIDTQGQLDYVHPGTSIEH